MNHYPALVRFRGGTDYEWHCGCGYFAGSRAEFSDHVIRSSHILHLMPPGAWKCWRCDGVWFTESAAEAAPCYVERAPL